MSRDGSDIYSVPPGTAAVSGTPVGSSAYNTFIADLVNDLNTPRPVSMGGTGASTASGALTNLGALPTDADIVAIAALGYAARSTLVKTAANTWTLVPQTTFGDSVLALTDAAGLRSLAGLGTAATKNTGTSGNNVPLLDGANTWSAKQLFTAGGFGTEIDPVNTRFIFAKWAEMSSDAGGNALFANNLYANYDGSLVTYKTTQTNGFVGYAGIRFGSGFAQIARFAGATTAGATVTPTWDEVATANNTLTLAGKTLSSPTLSGTVAGSVTFSGTINLSQAGDNVMRIATTGGAQSAALELSADTSAKLWSIVAVGSGLGSDSLIFRDGGWAAGSTRFTIEATGDLVGTSVGPTSVYSLGYRGLGTLNGQNTAYTFVLTDAGRNVYHGSGTHAYQIPPNSSVAFPVGTVIEILQDGGTLTITEGSGVTLERWDGVSGTGTRTVGAKSSAVIQKVNTNNWIIMGALLS